MTADRSSEEPSLLLVDDDDVFRGVMARALRSRGFHVLEAADYKAALVMLRVSAPRYAVVDVRMAGRSGLELLRSIREVRPSTVVLVLTGDRSAALETEVAELGARYLSKPADADQVVEALSASQT